MKTGTLIFKKGMREERRSVAELSQKWFTRFNDPRIAVFNLKGNNFGKNTKYSVGEGEYFLLGCLGIGVCLSFEYHKSVTTA